MLYRVHRNPFHGGRLDGDYPTLDAAYTAAACSPSGTPDAFRCLCGGGSVVAVLETDADRALVAETVDGMRYAYVPGDFGVELPLPFVEAKAEEAGA